MSRTIFSLICMALVVEAFASRLPPKMVLPVSHGGIAYMAPHVTEGYFSKYGKLTCQLGCIEAWDEATGKMLWQAQVYKVRYFPILEKDVQDVFIRSLSVENSKLCIEDEKSRKYSVDLKSHEVKRLWRH